MVGVLALQVSVLGSLSVSHGICRNQNRAVLRVYLGAGHGAGRHLWAPRLGQQVSTWSNTWSILVQYWPTHRGSRYVCIK